MALYFSGTVTDMHLDDKGEMVYKIEFDDGEVEDVPQSRVRKVLPSLAACALEVAH